MIKRAIVVIAYLAVAAGCAGPASRTVLVDKEEAQRPLENWTEVEDFDASVYDELQPSPQPALEHEVPAALLESRLLEPSAPREVGHRIQILFTEDEQEANHAYGQAIELWQELKAVGELPESCLCSGPESVYLDFRDPNYRVRIGDFVEEECAKRVLKEIEQHYSSSIVVPDLVAARTRCQN